MTACPACARLEKVARGEDPHFICRLRESVVLLHKHQPLPGWCSLFIPDHAEHLGSLSRMRQAALWDDVMDVAQAINRAFSPRRLNYENLGNVVAHVHWHVVPRYEPPIDPEPGATIWTRPVSWLDSGVSDEQRREYVERLRDAGLR